MLRMPMCMQSDARVVPLMLGCTRGVCSCACNRMHAWRMPMCMQSDARVVPLMGGCTFGVCPCGICGRTSTICFANSSLWPCSADAESDDRIYGRGIMCVQQTHNNHGGSLLKKQDARACYLKHWPRKSLERMVYYRYKMSHKGK